MKIKLDFDGTVVVHRYPNMGNVVPFAIRVIEKLKNAGHKIILNTYRADCNDGTLEEAINFLQKHDIDLSESYNNRKEHPNYWDWEFFEANDMIFIDDICEGIPMMRMENSWVVDWRELDKQFKEKKIY